MRNEGSRHRFGGDWTQKKLAILSEYLHGYHKALKNQRFQKCYIDAFAGTGYVEPKRPAKSDPQQEQAALFGSAPAEVDDEEKFIAGSARVALQCDPPFDRYVFIEKNPDRCQALESLRIDFPHTHIEVRQGEANVEIQTLCEENWNGRRAVTFLDPYGTQVQWTTIQAIGRTGAIDLWVLFPIGMGVNRMLTKSGEIPESWRRRLNELLGATDWYEKFYRIEVRTNLFGEPDVSYIKERLDVIAAYFLGRLQGCFAGVAEHPALLRNSTGSPLYLLCFAAANPKGADIAVRIAEGVLKKMGS